MAKATSPEDVIVDEEVDNDIPASEGVDKPFQVSARTLAYIKGESGEAKPDETLDPVADDAASETEAADVDAAAVDEPAVAAEETATDPVADAAPPAPWYNGSDLLLATRYELDAADLSQMTGREELVRHAALAERRQAKQPAATATDASAEAAPASPFFNNDGTLNKQYCDEQGLDDVQIATLQRQADLQQSLSQVKQENDWMRAQYIEQQTLQYANALHQSVDKLGRPEFYGRAFDDKGRAVILPPEVLARRSAINDEVAHIAESYARRNAQVPNLDALTKRAELIVYADEIAAIDAKKQAVSKRDQLERIAKQSTRRRPVASLAGAMARTPVEADPNSPEAILRTPAFAKWRKEKAEEYGEAIN